MTDQKVIEQLNQKIKTLQREMKQKNRIIEQLVEAGDALHSIGEKIVHQGGEDMYWIRKLEEYLPEWKEAKEAKP